MNVNKSVEDQNKDIDKARGQKKVVLHEQKCGREYK